jgi:hypothetical protein
MEPMSISTQLGAFFAVATGYVLVAFAWGWYKRREQSGEPVMTDESDESSGGDS